MIGRDTKKEGNKRGKKRSGRKTAPRTNVRKVFQLYNQRRLRPSWTTIFSNAIAAKAIHPVIAGRKFQRFSWPRISWPVVVLVDLASGTRRGETLRSRIDRCASPSSPSIRVHASRVKRGRESRKKKKKGEESRGEVLFAGRRRRITGAKGDRVGLGRERRWPIKPFPSSHSFCLPLSYLRGKVSAIRETGCLRVCLCRSTERNKVGCKCVRQRKTVCQRVGEEEPWLSSCLVHRPILLGGPKAATNTKVGWGGEW